jgi:hypothetical protein
MLAYKCVDNCTVYYHYTPNRTCLLSCPNGYFYNNSGVNNKFCEPCASPCQNCINSTTCLTCSSLYFFFNYTCSLTCPLAFYKGADNTCEVCISPCKLCTSKSNCLSCSQGFWNGTNCISICLNGYYGNKNTNNCEICTNNCLTCVNSSSICTSCSVSLIFH